MSKRRGAKSPELSTRKHGHMKQGKSCRIGKNFENGIARRFNQWYFAMSCAFDFFDEERFERRGYGKKGLPDLTCPSRLAWIVSLKGGTQWAFCDLLWPDGKVWKWWQEVEEHRIHNGRPSPISILVIVHRRTLYVMTREFEHLKMFERITFVNPTDAKRLKFGEILIRAGTPHPAVESFVHKPICLVRLADFLDAYSCKLEEEYFREHDMTNELMRFKDSVSSNEWERRLDNAVRKYRKKRGWIK